jgi:hypothetical protein
MKILLQAYKLTLTDDLGTDLLAGGAIKNLIGHSVKKNYERLGTCLSIR